MPDKQREEDHKNPLGLSFNLDMPLVTPVS
ncbi:hypothetical protein BX283_7452 [Streptomyces sp. TLI_146]|nr:hypothetical protein BX283_7452 [Streptomyces sp. TLI_146]